MKRTLIWTISTRIFHWLLVFGIIAAILSGDNDAYLSLHFAIGSFVGIIILFRILYGFIGPKYSRFSDFPIGIKHQIEFIKTGFNKTKIYAGHNPVASIVMIAIFVVGILCCVSGFLIIAPENGLPNLNINREIYSEVHEGLVICFAFLMGLHLTGIGVDLIFHRNTGTIQSIFTGYKNIEADNTNPNIFQKIFTVFWFLVPVLFLFSAYNLKYNKQKETHHSESTGKHEREDED